jgi:dolichyl-phosphate-mannose-protein mannosyltransferase
VADVIRVPTWPRWTWLGVVMGLGLLNKISMLWFGLGLAIGLVLTPNGRRILRPATVLAGLVAILVFSPHLAWQSLHGWPTLEFMRNAAGSKMAPVSPVAFLRDQFEAMGFANVLVYLPGLAYGLFSRTARPWQIFGVMFLSVATLLIGAGTSRASYLTVAYPALFALGALAWERWTADRLRWVREAFLALLVALALPWIPFALPILPADVYVRYQTLMGQQPSTEERKRVGPLPQGYADMFGWPELAAEVAKAADRLTPEERRGAVVFGQNYGEAAAIDVLGKPLGLPPAVSGHNNYYLWGPGSWDGKVMIIIGGDPADNASFFESVERVGVWSHPYAMPYERGLDISIARGFKGVPAEVWPRLKHFD